MIRHGFLIILIFVGLALTSEARQQPDSANVGDTVAVRPHVVSQAPAVHQIGLSDRLAILMVGVVSVGGITLLLDRMRRKADAK